MDRAHAFALTSPTISLIRAPNEAVCVAALFYSDDQGMSDEADFSAEQPGAGAPARLPRADGDGGCGCPGERRTAAGGFRPLVVS